MDLHQHPRALLWLESNGYIDDVDLDRYARPLKRARLALLDICNGVMMLQLPVS